MQVEGFVEEGVKDEEILDDGVVVAVDDFTVDDIVVEDAVVDDAVVDDACFVDDATVDNAGAEDVIEEDAVVEGAAVDEGAGDDATDDTVAADDALNEADELGRLLRGRISSVYAKNDEFCFCFGPCNNMQQSESVYILDRRQTIQIDGQCNFRQVARNLNGSAQKRNACSRTKLLR